MKVTRVWLTGRYGSENHPSLHFVFDYVISADREHWLSTAHEIAAVTPWWFHSTYLDQVPGEEKPIVLVADVQPTRTTDPEKLAGYVTRAEELAVRVVAALDKVAAVYAEAQSRVAQMTIKATASLRGSSVTFAFEHARVNYAWTVDTPISFPPAAEIQAALEAREREMLSAFEENRERSAASDQLSRKAAARRGVETRELNRALDDLKAQVDAWKPEAQ